MNTRLTNLIALFIGCSVFYSEAIGDTRYVSPHGSAESGFTTLKTAARDIASVLDVARDGDLIVVAPGTYQVRKTIYVNRAVKLISAGGAGETMLVGQKDSPAEWCFDIHSNRAIVDGFTISRFRGGVRFSHGEGTSAVVRNCVIARNAGHGIFFNHGGCAKNCTVVFNEGAGLYAYDMGGGGDSPANMILFGNKQPFVRQSANISLRNSVTEDPLFVSDLDFRLTEDSPCIDQGKNEPWMEEALDASGSVRIRNRIVDVGAFEFRPSDAVTPKTSGKKSKWIELLPLVKPPRDLKNAVWSWEKNGALFSSGKVQAKVSVPLNIQGSYEFQTRLTMVRAKEAVAILLPVSKSKSIELSVKGEKGNTESKTSTLRLKGVQGDVKPLGNVTLTTGKEYHLWGRVLQDGEKVSVDFYCNDELVYRWRGSLGQIETRVLQRPGTVQLQTAYYTTARLADFRIQMLSGDARQLKAKSNLLSDASRKKHSPELLMTDATTKAVDRYFDEIREIERVANQRKQEAKERLKRSLGQLEKYSADAKSGRRFRGMLGSYFNHQSRVPFVMISVPDGQNIRNEYARKCFNEGGYDDSKRLYKFEATGHVKIPKDGKYRLIVSRAAGIKLNGREYAVGAKVAGEPPYADVQLTQGIYQVEFVVGNNGGQLQSAMVRIEDRQNKLELPIFVYESEVDAFRKDLSLGSRLIETSKWTKEENLIKQ